MLKDKELSHMKDVKVVASRHFASKEISTKFKLMETHSANCVCLAILCDIFGMIK